MSGRHSTPSTATEALFHACAALDHAAMARALDCGADVHGIDRHEKHPLGVFIHAWQSSGARPDPAPFVDLLQRHGANLSRPDAGEWASHTVEDFQCSDLEDRLLGALVASGMDWEDGIDTGGLLTRVVRNRAPNLLASLLQSPLDLDPDSADEDGQTALHALVDARVPHSRTRQDDTVNHMMKILFEVCASGDVPDLFHVTPIERFRQEAPELYEAWQALVRDRRALWERDKFAAALPDARGDAGKGSRRL